MRTQDECEVSMERMRKSLMKTENMGRGLVDGWRVHGKMSLEFAQLTVGWIRILTKLLRIRLSFANFPCAMYPVKCHVCFSQVWENGNHANLGQENQNLTVALQSGCVERKEETKWSVSLLCPISFAFQNKCAITIGLSVRSSVVKNSLHRPLCLSLLDFLQGPTMESHHLAFSLLLGNLYYHLGF